MRTFETENPDIISPFYRDQGFAYAFFCCVDSHLAMIEAEKWCLDTFGTEKLHPDEYVHFHLYGPWRVFLKTELQAFQFKMRFC